MAGRLLQQQQSDLKASLEPKDKEIMLLRDQLNELAHEFEEANRTSMTQHDVRRLLDMLANVACLLFVM